MEDKRAKIKSLAGLLIFVAFISGCVIYVGPGSQSHKFTKIVHMPAASLSPGLNFQTQTHNGSIKVQGSDATECSVIATITGQASSDEKAEELVEKTELRFEKSESGLKFVIDKPDNLMNCSVSVSLEVVLPSETNLDLVSHNGEIEIEKIKGNTNAVSHNGRVSVNNVSGMITLKTHNGEIEAKEIAGDIDFVSYNGQVEAFFSQAAAPDCDIKMVTHNGGIELVAPQNYSAKVDVSTHNGHIDTDLPITILGTFNGKKLVGTIGDRKGNLKLETYNGSINIK